jgi:methylenetetrahydrofolate reductase (NADPH)
MAWRIFGQRKGRTLTGHERAALRLVVERAKYELIPLKNARLAAERLPPGSTVTVTASPAHGIEATIALSEWLAARGHMVVPHLAAHMIRDRQHLSELLARARSAQLREAFVIGGDAKTPSEMQDALGLLRTMTEIGHPFERLGVAAYPEGHPDIADEVLLRVLKDKQRYAHSMTTQMSFNAEAVSAWVARMRSADVWLPVHIGVPGVTELTKLLTVAARIGVRDSARYLKKNNQMLGYLMRRQVFGPDAFLESLAPVIADADAAIGGLHLFTFNQVEETAAWQQRMLVSLAP